MTGPEAVRERLELTVRISPESANWRAPNPQYVEQYEKDLAIIKKGYVELIRGGLAKGKIELPDPQEGSVAPTPELQVLFLAHSMAVRDMTIAAVLGGHGLPQPTMCTLGYHGALIHYQTDPEIPIGGFELEGGLDRAEIYDQLRALA